MVSQEKKDKIKATLLATKNRRQLQICKVFELKIDESHLSKPEKERLKMYFVEAKWLYNHILNQENVFKLSSSLSAARKSYCSSSYNRF